MNRIWKRVTRLLPGILVLLLFFTALPVSAYTEGDAELFKAIIPVEITNVVDSKANIEQLEGPRTILPAQTTITPDEQGKGEFEMSFVGTVPGDVYKYRITEVPGTRTDVRYNATNKTYICEVWIFYDETSGEVYARAFLYESEEPLDMTDEANDSIPKPDKCEFLNALPPSATDATSIGRKGDTQTSDGEAASDGSDDTIRSDGKVSFIKGSGELKKISLYNPATGTWIDFTDDMEFVEVPAHDENGKVVGKYRITKAERDKMLHGEPGQVEFIPNPDFVGTPRPAQIRATDEYDFETIATYTPTVAAPPSSQDAETWGSEGQTQTSSQKDNRRGEVSFEKGDGDFVKVELWDPVKKEFVEFTDDMDVLEVPAVDSNGNVIGKYRITKEERDRILTTGRGTVEFIPNPGFVGTPQPAQIRVTDEYGYTTIAYYQPHVRAKASPKPSSSTSKSVKTGDDFKAILYTSLIAGAGAMLILLLVIAKRRKKN